MIQKDEVRFTNHFIDRYNERVGPATVEEIRERIVTPMLLNMINTLGNGIYPVENLPGYTVLVESKQVLVTIHPPADIKKRYHKTVVKPRRIKPRKR